MSDFIAFVNQQPSNAVKVTGTFFEVIEIGKRHLLSKNVPICSPKAKYRQAVCLTWLIISRLLLRGQLGMSKRMSLRVCQGKFVHINIKRQL